MKTLKTQLLAIFLVLLLTTNLPAQFPQLDTKRECGTVVTDRQKMVELERGSRGYNLPLAPQLNRPYQIPLTIHIVRQNDGTGGFTLADLGVAMQDLNRLWLPVGMQFYQRGAVDYINNTTHFNVPDNQQARDNLRQVNPVADTINVYFTNLTGLCGQSTFTTDPIQGILIANSCAGAGSPSTLAHEIGHYFDLYHTHETGFGTECPNGSNCSSTGDLLCDTPADPGLNFDTDVTAACVWTGTSTPPTGCGSTNYAPPTRNVMSYSRRTCRDTFVGGQISKALVVLAFISNRANLINTLTKYVAPDGGLTTNCTYQTPCRTPSRALEVANPGNTIFFFPLLTKLFLHLSAKQ